MSGIVGMRSTPSAAEQRRQVGAKARAKRRALGGLRVAHAARPREALPHAGAERRTEVLDQRAVGAPGLVAHRVAKAPVHRLEAVEHDRDRGRRRRAPPRPGRAARAAPPAPRARAAPRPRSATAAARVFGQRRGIGAEQHVGNAREGRHVAREPAAGVEARREVVDALEADAAVRRAQADEAAVVGRRPHRAAGVAAEGEVDQAVRHRRGRAATRSRR